MILVVIPALVVSGAAAAGFLGSWWWVFDLLANFRPQYAAVGTVLGVILVAGRWRRTGTAVLVVAAVNAGFVGVLYLDAPDTGPVTSETIRVMSFNIRSNNESMDAVFDYIDRIDPDVVFLHESTDPWAEAAREAGLAYDIYDVAQPGLIFSTLVLAPSGSEFESFGFAAAEPRAVEVNVRAGDDVVSVLGIHPISPTTAQRAALRNAQLDWAADWAAATSGPAVVVGDFNASPWSAAFRSFLSTSGFHDSTRGFGLQPSFPMDENPLVRVQIDQLAHSGSMAVLDRRLGPRLGSDHAPLIVDLAVTG